MFCREDWREDWTWAFSRLRGIVSESRPGGHGMRPGRTGSRNSGAYSRCNYTIPLAARQPRNMLGPGSIWRRVLQTMPRGQLALNWEPSEIQNQQGSTPAEARPISKTGFVRSNNSESMPYFDPTRGPSCDHTRRKRGITSDPVRKGDSPAPQNIFAILSIQCTITALKSP